MIARVCCSLTAVLLCLSVYLSTTDAQGSATTKPGVCPSENLGVGLCVEMCFDDGDCPNDEKCCGGGCGHHCMPPYKEPEKPGLCPKNLEIAHLGDCAERCSHDSDCPNDEKCCSKGCEHQCMPPYRDLIEENEESEELNEVEEKHVKTEEKILTE